MLTFTGVPEFSQDAAYKAQKHGPPAMSKPGPPGGHRPVSIAALQESEFANLGDKLLLSILIRVRRDSHRAIAATCRKFQLLVCGRLFIAARIQCPTTGLPCEFAPCRQTGSCCKCLIVHCPRRLHRNRLVRGCSSRAHHNPGRRYVGLSHPPPFSQFKASNFGLRFAYLM